MVWSQCFLVRASKIQGGIFMVDQGCQKIKKVIKVVFQDYRKLFKPTHRSSFIFFLTCFANVYILQQVFTKGKSIASQSVPNDEITYQKNLNEIPQNGHYSWRSIFRNIRKWGTLFAPWKCLSGLLPQKEFWTEN